MIPVQKIYDATHNGLDIILWLYPQAADCVGAKGKKFKVRDEKTPSACLYMRKSEKYGDIWGVTDFGGEGWRFSDLTLSRSTSRRCTGTP